MILEGALELLRPLTAFPPEWAVAAILALKAPQILKELFEGIRGIIVARRQGAGSSDRQKAA